MNKRALTPEEKRLWRHFTHDNQAINRCSERVESSEKPVKIKPKASYEAVALPPTPQSWMPDLQPGDLSQMDGRMAQRLRRGQLEPEATLDLHGYTQAEANHQFHHFLTDASARGIRVLRIITGYGKMSGGNGVLKAALPRWINLPENRRLVLGYHQARPEAGGAGAWMVLLKRKERL